MKSVTILNRFFIFILLWLLASCTEPNKNLPEEVRENLETFEVTFRYKVTNTLDSIAYGESASFAIPMKSSARHIVDVVDTNVTGEIINLPEGNREFYIKFDRLLPREVKIVTVSVRFSEIDLELYQPSSLSPMYLLETHLMPYQQPEFTKLISELKTSTTRSFIDNSYQWVLSNIRYSGYNSSTLGADYALKHKKGDCTEFSYLLAALLRGNRIPVRLVSGYVLEGNGILNPADFHTWLEVGIDGVWRVVDAQKRHFGQPDNAYFSISYLDGVAGDKRFSYSSNITVSMF